MPAPAPTQTPPQTKGTTASCPCPWCGTPHNFMGMDHLTTADLTDAIGGGGIGGGMATDAKFQCNNRKVVAGPPNAQGQVPMKILKGCGQFFQIARVMPVTLLWLARVTPDSR